MRSVMSTLINVVFDASKVSRFPIHCHYAGQIWAQSAFIYLDLRDGELGADFNPAIGGGICELKWHNIVLTFYIPPKSHRDKVAGWIDQYLDDFQAIYDGSCVEHDGSNFVGVLNDEATEVYNRIRSDDEKLVVC